MAVNSEEKVVFDCCRKNWIDKLNEFKHSGKDVEFLSLKLEDIVYLKEFNKTLPNVSKLEIATQNIKGDLLEETLFPKLRNVIFLTPIPKNLWRVFTNLEEISFGLKGHIELFTSEFINGIIEMNQNTLTKLKLIHIAVAKCSYEPLKIPCQLKELAIEFCFDGLIEEIARNERERMIEDSSRGNKRFFIRKKQIATFENARQIIESQKNLKHLEIGRIVIDEDFLEAIAGTRTRSLILNDTALRFDSVNDRTKEFIRRLQNVSLSHLSNKPGFKLILEVLRDVETLNIHHIANYKMKHLEEKNILTKLKTVRMHENCLIKEIFDSLQFTKELEEISCVITYNEQIDEISRSSPNLKRFFLDVSRLDVIKQVLEQFNALEMIEARLWCFELEIMNAILSKSDNLKYVLIFINNSYCDEEDQQEVRNILKPEFRMIVDNDRKRFEIKNNRYFHLIVDWG